jgi:hypothetical protein
MVKLQVKEKLMAVKTRTSDQPSTDTSAEPSNVFDVPSTEEDNPEPNRPTPATDGEVNVSMDLLPPDNAELDTDSDPWANIIDGVTDSEAIIIRDTPTVPDSIKAMIDRGIKLYSVIHNGLPVDTPKWFEVVITDRDKRKDFITLLKLGARTRVSGRVTVTVRQANLKGQMGVKFAIEPYKESENKPTGGVSEAGLIRAWARNQQIPVTARGRIPQEVINAYNAASRAETGE